MSRTKATFQELFRVRHGFAFKSKFFDSFGPYALLTPGNFHEAGGFRDRGEKQPFYTGDVPPAFILDEGDLVVAMTEQEHGLLGSSAWIPKSNYYLHNQRLGRVTELNEARLCKRYLYYLFNTREVRAQIAGSATGTKVRHTAPDRIGRVQVEIPSVDRQSKIAEVLTAYDDLIENNRRRMVLLEQAARKLYREWFIHLRFPGHENTPIREGLPEGWELRTLGDVSKINRANVAKAFDADIEYIDISAVTPGRINETTPYHFRDAPSRARRVVQHGDIIWSCVRPNRKSYAVVWNPCENLIASTGFAVITPNGVPSSFLEQATTTDDFVRHLENNAKGAAYPAVLASDFERAKLLIPPQPLIESFAAFAEPLLAQRHNLDVQNRKLRTARDRLLPKLMSGEIEV